MRAVADKNDFFIGFLSIVKVGTDGHDRPVMAKNLARLIPSSRGLKFFKAPPAALENPRRALISSPHFWPHQKKEQTYAE
jgi:hypothetical protein